MARSVLFGIRENGADGLCPPNPWALRADRSKPKLYEVSEVVVGESPASARGAVLRA